jgi:hypothetical protein
MPIIPTYTAAMPFGAEFQSGENAQKIYEDEKLRQQARDQAEDNFKQQSIDSQNQARQLDYMMKLKSIAENKVSQERILGQKALEVTAKNISDTEKVPFDSSNPEHMQKLAQNYSLLKGQIPSIDQMQNNLNQGGGQPPNQPIGMNRKQKEEIRKKAYDAVKAGAKIDSSIYNLPYEEADNMILSKLQELKNNFNLSETYKNAKNGDPEWDNLKMIANGEATIKDLFPTGMQGSKNPIKSIITSKIKREIDPTFDISQFQKDQKMYENPALNTQASSIANAYKDLNVFKNASDAFDRGDIQLFNKYLKGGSEQFSNIQAINLEQAHNLLTEILSNALTRGSQGSSDFKMQFADKLLNPNLSKDAVNSQIEQAEKFLANKLKTTVAPAGKYAKKLLKELGFDENYTESANNQTKENQKVNAKDYLKSMGF